MGYDFIEKQYIPKNKDEYYLRYKQNLNVFGKEKSYRHLTAKEIETLVQNNNASDDWNKLLVTDKFDPDLVKNCQFFGLVRIGKLEPYYLEFHNLRRPVGLYGSTICSCDLGDNVVIDNVNFMAHYIIGDETILVNINEITTSPHAKFGNGIIKQGEKENVRIWLEICNENAGRKVLPFDGMLPGDAFLWSKYRDDEQLMKRFIQFTEDKFDDSRGYYGVVGARCIVKNSKTIKDCYIKDYAYIKGANKLKNLTLNSSAKASSQIGEGCELVNGVIGYGCRIFYGVKAVRFHLASHSTLKYGARLINSYLGNNSTISCCEVLNSLIFPTHEQHHNNSFLCAAMVMGQSNIAAGATIGSNHNSRSADGELILERGVWPGLSVSLSHNSRFATFSLIAKGEYPYEINSKLPFALISNDTANNTLNIMPGYWFLYNMYALSRNTWKSTKRDKRINKTQCIEYDYLAPDSVEEMFEGLNLIEVSTGKAALIKNSSNHKELKEEIFRKKGRTLLNNHPEQVKELKINLKATENSKRQTNLLKAEKGYKAYQKMIIYYGVQQIVMGFHSGRIKSLEDFNSKLKQAQRQTWVNVGGQLIIKDKLEKLKTAIKQGQLNSWDELHNQYTAIGASYADDKLEHAIASLKSIKNFDDHSLSKTQFKALLQEFSETITWIQQQVLISRKKDYTNKFRSMIYDNNSEMEKVLGRLQDDEFIRAKNQEKRKYEVYIEEILKESI